MDAKILTNILDPPILFFFFGVFAALIKSNLEVPPPLTKFLSLYLLMAIGMKGGASLAVHGISRDMALVVLAAIFMAMLVPLYSFFILRVRLKNLYDAAAIAATYGSVSLVTFIIAGEFINKLGIAYGGYMTVALVSMESPAIVMAVLLASAVRNRGTRGGDGQTQSSSTALPMRKILHETFTDGTHLMLIGSVVIGAMTGEEGKKVMEPFIVHIFRGMLAFYHLEMGLTAAIRLRELKGWDGAFLVGFGMVMPVINASVALAIGQLLGLTMGDTFMFMVLAASASYIAVPAVVRYAIPEANPSLYFSLALAVTFPFNIVFGLPLYFKMVEILWSG